MSFTINCMAAKCHHLEEAIYSSLNVPLNTVTDCAYGTGWKALSKSKDRN
jgi:hypothetical protein